MAKISDDLTIGENVCTGGLFLRVLKPRFVGMPCVANFTNPDSS